MLNELYQNIDPVAFSIGPFVVRWYGIAYLLGFAAAAFLIYRIAKRWNVKVDSDALLSIMLYIIIGIIVGARLGYIVFYGNGYYFQHPGQILYAGMSFHGGLIGALIAGIFAARTTGIPYLTLCDLGAIAAPVGLFFGRCANFINGELWGSPTDLAWGVVFGGSAGNIPRHPSQLYEALLEGLLLFLILYLLSRKMPPRPRGSFLGAFFTLYGIFRFGIEFIRQPDSQIGYLWGGWLTMGQLLCVPLILFGIIVLVYAGRKNLPQQGLPGTRLASASQNDAGGGV